MPELIDTPKLTLFDLPEAIELEVAGYLSVCDLISLLLCTKKASEYNRPAIWRQLLSIVNDLKGCSRSKKNKKRGVLRKINCKNVYRETFITLWKAGINEKRKSLLHSLLTTYDADMKLSIHKECIVAAKAAVNSRGLIVNHKQTVCRHNKVLLVHGKTIYPSTNYCSDSRELILHTLCSSCSSICYERAIICASCRDFSSPTSHSCCSDCFEAGKFKSHHNHPKVEFCCPRDYFLQKEYTFGCFDCGIAFVARIASSYKLRWQKSVQCTSVRDSHLSTAEFICTSRQNVFRNKLLNDEGRTELIFRMKVGDMLFNHSDTDLSSCIKPHC